MSTVSLIIVTRNRAEKLNRLLESIAKSNSLPEELILIDNDSTDNTKIVCNSFESKYNSKMHIKYLRENQVGISFARNRGLTTASCEIIAFTDDDCVISNSWIDAIKKAHVDVPLATAIGGLTENLPKNMVSYCGHLHRKFTTYCDVVMPVKNIDKIDDILSKTQEMLALSTQNISYKKKQINNLQFETWLAPTEAVDFSWKILNQGGQIVFDPSSIVYHEYRSSIYQLIMQTLAYGKSSALMDKNAITQKYFPHQSSPYSLMCYLKFCKNELANLDTNFFKKAFIMILSLAREGVFQLSHFYYRMFEKK